ncbi:hypothetical protein ES705_34936 [subsurface metagenome]
MKNFEDLLVLRKIKEFIQLYIPQNNRKKAIQAYQEYRKFWNQISHIGKSEEVCRKIFEKKFKTPFKKSYPKWLKSERGGQMHLDGYNSDLKIAFEYQGKQHYFFIPKWHQTIEIFKQRQADDKWKKKLCNINNIILIEVPYWVKYEEMLDYIINELKNRGISLPECSQSRKRDYFFKETMSKGSLNNEEEAKFGNPEGDNNIAIEDIEKKVREKIKNQKNEINNKTHENPRIKLEDIIQNMRTPFPYNKPRWENLNDEDFSDPYLWLSPQVRESIQSKAASLIGQVHEDVKPLENFSDPWEEVSIYDRSEFESNSAEDINDTPEGDIIPDQDIEPNSEISEIQDHNDTREAEINNTDEEIEDSISEQQELIEDEISNFEQINYSEKREGDLRPENFNPILQPVYDPLSQPITELIPPPETPLNPQDINTPHPENEPVPQNYPPNQQEQDEVSQVPDQSQEEVGTEQDIEEISDNSNVPDNESVINEPTEENQIPEPSVSGTEDLSDKTDIGHEASENANQEESKNSPNSDEKDEDSDKDKDEKEEIKDEKDDDKDEEKEKDDEDNKDESDDDADEEKDDEDDESSKENDDDSKEDEEESDDEGQEESNDDMDDFEEDSERGFDPTDIYDPINVIDFSELYPQIPALHSSSIDHSNGDVQIIDVDDFREPFCDIKIGGEDFQEGDITEVPHFTSEGFTDDLLNDEINDANLVDSFRDMI